MLTKNLPPINVLVLESRHSHDDFLKITIPDLPCQFKKVDLTETHKLPLNFREYAIVLVDLESDHAKAVETVQTIKRLSPDTLIIALTDQKNPILADAAVKAGADDCVLKSAASSTIQAKLKNLCEMTITNNKAMLLRQQVAMNYAFDNLIGGSAEMQRIKRTVPSVANDDTVVVLSGEDGTGKNLLCKIIHYHSSRRNNPLIKLDCTAMTESQFQYEIVSKNLFERAASGTLFIDQLHLLNPVMLAKLQTQLPTLRKNGSLDFRLIISVNRHLYDLYSCGILDRKFLEGLEAVEIHLPPLRQRTEDIQQLVSYFLRIISFETGCGSLSITSAALELLKEYSWPGNVGELKYFLNRASAVCNYNCIDVTDVSLPPTESDGIVVDKIPRSSSVKTQSLVENQRHLIALALDANGWNFTQTARQLGIGRTTLWRKVRKFNLKRETSNRLKMTRV